MDVFQIALILSAFLCSLVAGFLFAYAIVVMPGINKFNDKQFISAFQVTDRIIQDNQPIFMLVWLGSAIAVVVSAFYGLEIVQGVDFILLCIVTVGYLAGVQLLTVIVHLPLNNKLQKLNVNAMSDSEIYAARTDFEPRWNQANRIRTAIASCVSLLLMVLLYRQ